MGARPAMRYVCALYRGASTRPTSSCRLPSEWRHSEAGSRVRSAGGLVPPSGRFGPHPADEFIREPDSEFGRIAPTRLLTFQDDAAVQRLHGPLVVGVEFGEFLDLLSRDCDRIDHHIPGDIFRAWRCCQRPWESVVATIRRKKLGGIDLYVVQSYGFFFFRRNVGPGRSDRSIGSTFIQQDCDYSKVTVGILVNEMSLEGRMLTEDGSLTPMMKMKLHQLEGLVPNFQGAAGSIIHLNGMPVVYDI